MTAIEIVDSSYLAIGCHDGSIRIWDCEEWQVIKVFQRGSHTKAVTHLLSFSNNLRQRPLLLSAGNDGVINI